MTLPTAEKDYPACVWADGYKKGQKEERLRVAKELRERILKHGLTEDWVIYELRELIEQLEDGENAMNLAKGSIALDKSIKKWRKENQNGETMTLTTNKLLFPKNLVVGGKKVTTTCVCGHGNNEHTHSRIEEEICFHCTICDCKKFYEKRLDGEKVKESGITIVSVEEATPELIAKHLDGEKVTK